MRSFAEKSVPDEFMSSGLEIAKALVAFVRDIYGTDDFIPLHEPVLGQPERDRVLEAIDSGFVSSVGAHVTEFEGAIASFIGARYGVATVNGTAALHACLLLCGVEPDDEVVTQSITFVATCNAIRYCRASPVFVDIDRETLGMSPESLAAFLDEHAYLNDKGSCINRATGRVVRACLPMHNFGHPVRIEEIAEICRAWNIVLIEDAAEALGSYVGTRHVGLFGRVAALSFNGNKIITTGGGGMIVTDDEALARHAKHLTTTAKKPHPWLYIHDEVAFNYRLPALNAALGCAQASRLPEHLRRKRLLAKTYSDWFGTTGYRFNLEPEGCRSNYWLNSFLARDRQERDDILEATNASGVMTRPVWTPMHSLDLYKSCQKVDLPNTDWIEARLVNIPSGVPPAASS